MSDKRMIFWLATACTIAAAWYYTLEVRTVSPAHTLHRATLLPSASSATSFVIRARGAAPIRLARTKGGWQLKAPFESAADEESVLRISDALSFVPYDDVYSHAALFKMGRSRADFDLDKPYVEVDVISPSTTNTVRFGKDTAAHDGIYAEVVGVQNIYILPTNAFASINCSVGRLRSHSLLRLVPEEVTAFDVRLGANAFKHYLRDEAGVWHLNDIKGPQASTDHVAAFLKASAEAVAEDFLWPKGETNEAKTVSVALLSGYGLDPENAITVSFKQADGRSSAVVYARATNEGKVYALAQNGTAIVTTNPLLRDLLLKGDEAFVDLRLFPLEPAKVTRLVVSDEDSKILLSLDPAAGWRLDAPVSAPADSARVASFIARILSLRRADVDPKGVSVAIETNAQPVSVSRKALLGTLNLAELRSREVIRIAPQDVKRFVLTEGAKPPIAVLHDAERHIWNVERAEKAGVVDSAGLTARLKALNPLLATAVVSLSVPMNALPRYGLDMPRFIVAVDSSGEKSIRRNILIGEKTDRGYYATLGSSDSVFLLPEKTVQLLTAPLLKP